MYKIGDVSKILGISPDLLRSHNYITHLFVVKKELFDRVGGFRPAFDGAQDYDLILRACAETALSMPLASDQIVHIGKVLYHWRSHPASTAMDPASKAYAFEAGQRAVQAHYDRLKIPADVICGEYPGLYVTLYRVPSDGPMISVIIPSARPDATSPGISSFTGWMISAARGRFARANFSLSPPGFSMTRTSGRSIAARLTYLPASSTRQRTVLPFAR